MKKVSVVTVDARKFIEDILDLGSKGGKIDESCVAYKGMFLRAEVMLPSNAIVELNERVSVSAEYVAEAVKKQEQEVVDNVQVDTSKVYTKEELEQMSIKQVKEVTGLSGRDKEKMINEYLEDKLV